MAAAPAPTAAASTAMTSPAADCAAPFTPSWKPLLATSVATFAQLMPPLPVIVIFGLTM